MSSKSTASSSATGLTSSATGLTSSLTTVTSKSVSTVTSSPVTIITSGVIIIEEDANGNEITLTADSQGSRRSPSMPTDASSAQSSSMTAAFAIGTIVSIVLMVF